MGFAFYIVYGLRRFGMSDLTAGLLTAAVTITSTIANAVMGWLGDRLGHRAMLIAGSIAVTLSSLIAWGAPSLNWMYLVFILSGLANVAYWTIGMAITTEFGTEETRPTYIGLSNTLVAPFTIIAPLLGGWIADSGRFPGHIYGLGCRRFGHCRLAVLAGARPAAASELKIGIGIFTQN